MMQSSSTRPDGRAVASAARRYIGVRWRHQGRNRERGLDCIGLLLVTATDVGLWPRGLDDLALRDYARYPDGDMMHRLMVAHLDRAPQPLAIGNVLELASESELANHIAIVTRLLPRPAVVHGSAYHRRVVEHDVTREWRKRNKVLAEFVLPGMLT